jgi:hypothetical protein
VRPFEVNKGETDRVIQEFVKTLTDTPRDRKRWHIMDAAPSWAKPYLEKNKKLEGIGCTLGKIGHNLYGKEYVDALHACRDSINAIEIDRLRVKPVIKIIGEFWAQTTEGDGNFNMFAFLEKEGAQVLVEPIATWIAYMMYVAKEGAKARADAEAPYRDPKWYEVKKRIANDLKIFKKTGGLSAGSAMWTHFYHAPLSTWATRHIIWFRRRSFRGWRIPSIISLRAAARATWKWARMSTTPSITSATWSSH